MNCIRVPKQHCTGPDSGRLTGWLHWDGEGYSTINTGCEGNERRQTGREEQDSENSLAVKEKLIQHRLKVGIGSQGGKEMESAL